MRNAADLKITEVAFAKNEGRFFLEWIAYHRLIGVTNFLIYTNDCEDDSPALLERLQEMGIVAHVPNPSDQPQNTALSHALRHPLVKNADYVLQIDIDEFLCIKTGGGRIAELIATAPGADVICIQMRFFGDCGLARLPAGLVVEHLTGASREDFVLNDIVKSLARNTNIFTKITSNHMPTFEFVDGRGPHLFNCGGQEIAPQAYGRKRIRTIPEDFRSMKYAQLNHYAVKTFADYRAKKYRGTAANNDKKLNMGYWRRRNRNDVQDTAILRHVPDLKNLMDTWLHDPVLAKCNRRCFEAYEDILKKSEGIFPSGP